MVAPNAVQKWRQCLGATNPSESAPGTLRNLYGENTLKNVAHGCNTLEDATQVRLKDLSSAYLKKRLQ